jgi:hypothetical protein
MKRTAKVFSVVLHKRHILISSIVMIAIIVQSFVRQYPGDRSSEIKPVATRTSSNILNEGKTEILESYANLPLHFEANLGQADPRVSFLSRGSAYDLFLTSTEAVFSFKKLASNDIGNTPVPKRNSASANPAVMRMKLIGANQAAKHVGLSKLVTKTNYFIGNNPQKWRTNISTYAKVQQHDVYPGVDLVYYGNQQQLEYDFVVSPGADYDAIKLDFEGPEKVEIESNGDLALYVEASVVRQHKPFIYQEVDGRRRSIDGGYVLISAQGEHNSNSYQIGFRVDEYDRSKDLIIDPVLSYSTYLGGSDSESDSYVVVDNAGSAYITGGTSSLDFPTANALQDNLSGGGCAFISKLNPTGSGLLFSTYLGGSFGTAGSGITVDGSGNIYVTGSTGSPDFPTVNAIQSNFGGLTDVFVTKLNATGSAILYSTYLGGNASDDGRAIGLDSLGNTYVAGMANSFDFPTVNALQPTFGGVTDAFVAKLSATGSTLIYSTFFGGDSSDVVNGNCLKVDGAGNAYIAGDTVSSDFPITPGAFQTTFGGGHAVFVVKLNPTGSAIVYSTYLGGNSGDSRADGIAVDSSGNVYVAGRTNEVNFPTHNALQAVKSGIEDAFITKINSLGSALIFSTFLGGSSFDASNGLAIDAAENIYITGETSSPDFPTANPLQPVFAGPSGTSDAFVAKLNSAGSALVYSTYFGGSSDEGAFGIAVDTAGNAYVSGITESADFQTSPGAFQTTFNGSTDPFILKLAGNETSTGTGVSVQSGQVTTTFATVASSGLTTVNPIDPTSAGVIPNAYTIADFSLAFDIQTSAVVSGPITIAFNVPFVNDPEVFGALRVLHNEGGVLVDRTVLPPDLPVPNFASRTIFARVTSLSPFVIVKLKSAEQLLNDLIAVVRSFNLQRGIENSLDAKLQNAQDALSAAKARDKVGACQMMTAFNNEVQAQRGKAITEDQANQLTSGANPIRTALGCPN